jgi:hypothetical protein
VIHIVQISKAQTIRKRKKKKSEEPVKARDPFKKPKKKLDKTPWKLHIASRKSKTRKRHCLPEILHKKENC